MRTIRQIEKDIDSITFEILNLVECEVCKLMLNTKKLHEFNMCMGSYSFFDSQDKIVDIQTLTHNWRSNSYTMHRAKSMISYNHTLKNLTMLLR